MGKVDSTFRGDTTEGELPFSLLRFVTRYSSLVLFDSDGGDNRYLVMAGERPVQDQYGRVTFQRTR